MITFPPKFLFTTLRVASVGSKFKFLCVPFAKHTVLSHFGPTLMFRPNWRTHKTLLEKSGGSVTLLCHSMNDSIKLSATKTAKQYHHSDSAALVPCSLRLEPNEMNRCASTAKQHHRSDFAAVALCSTRFEFNVTRRLRWSVVARKYPIHRSQFGHTHLPSAALKI